jgi:hypothetical protein
MMERGQTATAAVAAAYEVARVASSSARALAVCMYEQKTNMG